ncbi:zinc ribbon domain-containing protein [Candidatus Bathyarchaeota archaeon]|nr:zinc ribbon domain-containing protein [Candidatus Bathyarchaeota archaeon]
MVKKGLCVWLFSSFTFIATLHLFDAISVLFFDSQIRLLQIYPLINKKLDMIPPVTYFWVSAAASLIFWGITCAIAFDNPVEHFLNVLLSDAKKQGSVEAQLVEEKSSVLDALYETVESSNETLAHVKDMLYNVRNEVRQMQPITESVEKVKAELTSLKREFRRLDEVVKSPDKCPSCGKGLSPEFKLCPFCGKSLRLLPEKVISLKNYR